MFFTGSMRGLYPGPSIRSYTSLLSDSLHPATRGREFRIAFEKSLRYYYKGGNLLVKIFW